MDFLVGFRRETAAESGFTKNKAMAIDLFSYPPERKEKLHRDFLRLTSDLAHGPARAILLELQKRFNDPDGNFVEQFQTNGFDARTFELFLFAMFEDEGHSIDRSFDRPDFMLNKRDFTVAVEAVTANRLGGKAVPYSPFGPDRSEEEWLHHLRNDLAIKVGSPLFSKLNKRYWELPHVAGKPFILALECFHEDGSLSHSSAPVEEYLFGTRHTWYRDEAGQLVIVPEAVREHRGYKTIPSGFFHQPYSEHVSAVLFCNTGTIAKFNRMGHQRPSSKSRFVRMFRIGAAHHHDDNATMPAPFLYEVGHPDWVETWSEGTVLIHNPRALHPLPAGWLGAGVESRLQPDGQVVATFSRDGFMPYWSETHLIPFSATKKQVSAWIEVCAESLQAALKEKAGPFK